MRVCTTFSTSITKSGRATSNLIIKSVLLLYWFYFYYFFFNFTEGEKFSITRLFFSLFMFALRYVEIALESHRVNCRVHDETKIILLARPDQVLGLRIMNMNKCGYHPLLLISLSYQSQILFYDSYHFLTRL